MDKKIALGGPRCFQRSFAARNKRIAFLQRVIFAGCNLIRISADLWDVNFLSRTFFRIPEDNQRGTLKRFYGLQKSASLLFEGAAALGNR